MRYELKEEYVKTYFLLNYYRSRDQLLPFPDRWFDINFLFDWFPIDVSSSRLTKVLKEIRNES